MKHFMLKLAFISLLQRYEAFHRIIFRKIYENFTREVWLTFAHMCFSLHSNKHYKNLLQLSSKFYF